MGYVPIEKLLERTGNSIYKLVILAAKRGLEIAEGSPVLVTGVSLTNKPATLALYEIAAGKVYYQVLKA